MHLRFSPLTQNILYLLEENSSHEETIVMSISEIQNVKYVIHLS